MIARLTRRRRRRARVARFLATRGRVIVDFERRGSMITAMEFNP